MADNIVLPLPEPTPEPAGDQTVIVNVTPAEPVAEPEAAALAEAAAPVIDHAERRRGTALARESTLERMPG